MGSFFKTSLGGGAPVPCDCPACSVPTCAALTALPDLSIPDGCRVGVASVLADYVLRKDSTAFVDGITVLFTFSGTGRWERCAGTNQFWLDQSAWWIDSGGGSDEANGLTPISPLRTFAELFRRLDRGQLDHLVNVTLFGGFTENVEPKFTTVDPAGFGPGQMTIQGQRTVIYSGTVAECVPWDPSTDTRGVITDTGLPPGGYIASGWIGLFFVMTSGANVGAVGILCANDPADASGNSAFFAPMFNYSSFVGGLNPAPGDTYDVYDVTEIDGWLSIDGANCLLGLLDLRFRNTSRSQPVLAAWPGGNLFAGFCQFIGTYADLTGCGGEFAECRFELDQGDLFIGAGSSIYLDGDFFDHTGVVIGPGGVLLNGYPSVSFSKSAFNGPGITCNGTGLLVSFDWWGFFDYAAPAPALRVIDGGTMEWPNGLAWGNGNTFAYAIEALQGGSIFYVSGFNVPAILGATANDCVIQGTGGLNYGTLPSANPNTDARIWGL